jgi:TPR repeat protein
MLSASELGEESATFYIISSALRTGVLKDYASPLKRLGTLAKAGNPRAMALLGKFLLTQNKENEALDWIRRATRGPAGLDFEDASEALVSEGQILKSRGDVEGAQAAFRTAALELDNPTAYFYLSQLEERNSRQQEVYLLKAASSGILEAWHNLGAIELARLRAASAGPVREFGMAKEWFQVAAADGFGPSMLNLAQICKAEGQAEEGMRWLEKAEKLPEVKEQALKMMDDWRINQDSTSS